MIKNRIPIAILCWLVIIMLTYQKLAMADKASDTQKMLNEQVLAQPFSVPDEEKLNKYIEDATKRGTPPKSEPSKYWRQGYTCNDLRRYSWNDYRDCSYYYHYYGYYWSY